MANLEVSKNFEARKLNKRSGVPLSEAPVTIPYGAVLKNVQSNRDLVRFTFLEEPYQVEQSVLDESTRPSGPAQSAADAVTAPAGAPPPAETPAPEAPPPSVPPVSAAPVTASEGTLAPPLDWEEMDSGPVRLLRAKVHGGWLVLVRVSNSITFVPDSGYRW